MNESYFLQNIQQLLPTRDKDHLNAHKLFNLKGVEDGCVPLTKYFSVDIQVRGRLVHDIGILVKKDNIPLTDSKGRSTRTPAILGCNLILNSSRATAHLQVLMSPLNQIKQTNQNNQSQIHLALLKKNPNLKVST